MVPELLLNESDRSKTRYQAFQQSYHDRPDAFMAECIDWPEGSEPASYQLDILAHLPSMHRVSARGPHGLGKSAMAAIALHWYALTRDGKDWRVITTASVWAQLIEYLWPEIHKWSRLIKWDVVGREPYSPTKELFTLKLVLSTGRASAIASDDSQRIEGAHADYILYIFDESKIVPDRTWNSAEGAMSAGKEKLWLAVSTPGEPVGRFFQIHAHEPGYEDWWVRHVTLSEAIAANRIDGDWADQRKKQWGAGSSEYINRVLGQFAASGEKTVIPSLWIDAAVERGRTANYDQPITHIGMDIARFGGDVTVFAPRSGSVVYECIEKGVSDTMETAGEVVTLLRNNPGAIGVIDVIGIGAGVYDRVNEVLRELYGSNTEKIFPFTASLRSDWSDYSEQLLFRDSRSAAWWNMRQLLDPAYDEERGFQISLPDDSDLRAELVAPGYTSMSDGRVKVESKDDIRKRIGRSTNRADAVVMSFWEESYNVGMEFA